MACDFPPLLGRGRSNERHLVQTFIDMVLLRPYSFIPMLFFCLFAPREMGWGRAVLWMVVAYATAFAAEWGSVTFGFPFGWYFYVQAPTQFREYWVHGVPFFDSMSFIFLSYWTFLSALWITGEKQVFSPKSPFPWRTILVGAFLMMAADVVIDPIALRGEKWFLGTIYGYPFWGPYFGITYENFLGWWLVAFVIMTGFLALTRLATIPKRAAPTLNWIAPFLWMATIAFNIGIAVYLKQWLLVLCDFILMAPVFMLLIQKIYAEKR